MGGCLNQQLWGGGGLHNRVRVVKTGPSDMCILLTFGVTTEKGSRSNPSVTAALNVALTYVRS